ncbi:single-stranded DNA-binding protein [Nocardia sp. NPDC004722]
MAAGDTELTIVGRLTADPALRFTPAGAAVADLTVASNPRVFDRNTKEWKDGEALFLRCNMWRDTAENVAESLTRGMAVLVKGTLKQRSYETKDGDKRTVVELDVIAIGPNLAANQRAKVTKVAPSSGTGGNQDAWGGNTGNTGTDAAPPF